MPICLSADIESADITLLQLEFQQKLQELGTSCAALGLDVRLGCGVRGPRQQGRLWCRSRSIEEVQYRKCLLESCSGGMSQYINEAWAGLGPHVTDHFPGQSWHQLGEAADLFVVVAGKAVWDGSPASRVAEIATKLGLYHSNSMKTWHSVRRRWHVQLRKEETPMMCRNLFETWRDLEDEILNRYLFE